MKEFICYNYLFREEKTMRFKYREKEISKPNYGYNMVAEEVSIKPKEVESIQKESTAFEMRQDLLANALFRALPGNYLYEGEIELGGGKSIYKARIVCRPDMYVLTIDMNDTEKYKNGKQIVIIDNREDVQRILVERHNQTFGDIKKMERMLQSFLTKCVKEWGLAVDLYQLHNVEDFWDLVRYGEKYENGVMKINYSLPALNLERLKSGYLQTMNLIRRSYKGKMSFSIEATKGRKLDINDNDEYQRDLNKLMMEEIGGKCITITFRSNPEKEMNPCEKSFTYVKLDDKYFVTKTSILSNEEFREKIKELNDCLLDGND